MIEDVYFEWQPDANQKWDFRGTIKYWEIKNVAALEKEEGLKLLDAFARTHGCSLTEFIDVVFGPDKKRPTGPAPSAHTKIDRSARRFKALGHRKLTPSVITRYVGLLRTYRAELLPAEERPPTNVVPLRPK